MWLDFTANILFPPICVACRERIRRGAVCDACFSKITIRNSVLCGECLAPLRTPSTLSLPPARSACHPEFPFVLGAAGYYEDKTLQALIHNLKFRSMKTAAEPLGKLITSYIGQMKFDLSEHVAVPIPLSLQRRRKRGFNQSELIMRRFADAYAADALIRIKNTKPQSETTSEAERKTNIAGAFAIRDTEDTRARIRNKNILLIDDVCTSGSTFLEASQTLRAAGARTIFALATAKT